MSKRIISLLLIVAVLLSMTCLSFADDGDTSQAQQQAEENAEPERAVREDGLPNIDPYSWEYRLANSYNSISNYNNDDSKIQMSFCYGLGFDTRIYDNVNSFIEDTRKAGYPVYLNCGNLSWQYSLCGHYESMIRLVYGDAYHAALHELGPGCNDHQTALAFDITTDYAYIGTHYQKDPNAKYTETFAYMAEHCADYGFIVRYPENKSEYYGVACEGAHFRYVGEEAARYIMDNGLCLEEFLMLYGVSVIVRTDIADASEEDFNYVK